MISFRSTNCNENYLEVREGSENGELVKAFCGNEIPANIPAASGYWLKYRTDDQSPNKGFFAEFQYLDSAELTGTSGIIQNPTYPKFVRNRFIANYRITVKQGFLIRVEFNDFHMNVDEDDGDCYTYIKIFNGYDETAPDLEELCTDLPEPVVSDTNVLYIRYFVSTGFKSRFQLTWNKIVKNVTINDVVSPECPNGQVITLASEGEILNITSPGYPYGYGPNLDCEWIFVSALPSYRPVLTFKDVNLENMDGCVADYVSVYQSRADGSWIEINKLCELEFPVNLDLVGTPNLKVKFHSDYSRNDTGFNATVFLGCGGVFSTPEGIINYNTSTAHTASRFFYDCMWNITVNRGRKIQFEFIEMNIKNTSETCDSHVIIRNGIDEGSPILGEK